MRMNMVNFLRDDELCDGCDVMTKQPKISSRIRKTRNRMLNEDRWLEQMNTKELAN